MPAFPSPTVPKTNYDVFIGRLVSTAVAEIEKSTGRKVVHLSFPTPTAFDKPDNERCISVSFEERTAE